MSVMAIRDDHGQRRQRIAAVRCASHNWAVAIGPEAETISSCSEVLPYLRETGHNEAARQPGSLRSNRPERDDGALTWPWLRSADAFTGAIEE
jgi:hypothetical protein